MNLLEKYLNGDTILVYNEIERMGERAFEKDNLQEVNAVLRETMNRVAFNLEVIYGALKEVNYCFNKNPRYDFEYPLLKPKEGVGSLIARLEKIIGGYGYVPLSLKMFYEIVGSCNFTWDYDEIPHIPWEGADPIQIRPITDLLSEAEGLDPDDDEPMGLPVSADYYHKDNISGGPPYSIELTPQPQIDSQLINEENDTTFIKYLRITLGCCGFSRPDAATHLPDFIQYLDKVGPLLKPI